MRLTALALLAGIAAMSMMGCTQQLYPGYPSYAEGYTQGGYAYVPAGEYGGYRQDEWGYERDGFGEQRRFRDRQEQSVLQRQEYDRALLAQEQARNVQTLAREQQYNQALLAQRQGQAAVQQDYNRALLAQQQAHNAQVLAREQQYNQALLAEQRARH